MDTKDRAFAWVLVMCCLFGAMFAAIAFGLGMIFLTIQQAIGLAFLSFGLGTFHGATFGAKRIAKAVNETMKEEWSEWKKPDWNSEKQPRPTRPGETTSIYRNR